MRQNFNGSSIPVRPRILVLLAAFNGSEWIGEQVETILAQRSVDISLVISDDGSTDDTRGLVEAFTHDTRVHLVSPPGPTGSAAQNFLWLIRHTDPDRCDFVALADQDDLWDPDKLWRGCASVVERDAAGYSCAVTAIWPDGGRSILRQDSRITLSDFLFEGAGQGCTFVLTRNFYDRVRDFCTQNAALTADLHFHDWVIYALSRAWKLDWVFDPFPLMQYRQHQGNDTGARSSIGGIQKRLRLIKRGWYAHQLKAIARLCAVAAANDHAITHWNALLAATPGLHRRFAIARFCVRGGRRRPLDNAILVGAALLGWM